MTKIEDQNFAFDYIPRIGDWIITDKAKREHVGVLNNLDGEWELIPFEDTAWSMQRLKSVIDFVNVNCAKRITETDQ